MLKNVKEMKKIILAIVFLFIGSAFISCTDLEEKIVPETKVIELEQQKTGGNDHDPDDDPDDDPEDNSDDGYGDFDNCDDFNDFGN